LNSDDGLPGREGAFIVASFWLIENLAKMGKTNEAIDLFNRTMDAAPSHGLLSEEIDPASKELLGNYPQSFSHIGLINAALTINEAILNKQKP
jgi:GH15 family glucan-1,4-alpha-glucosidase